MTMPKIENKKTMNSTPSKIRGYQSHLNSRTDVKPMGVTFSPTKKLNRIPSSNSSSKMGATSILADELVELKNTSIGKEIQKQLKPYKNPYYFS